MLLWLTFYRNFCIIVHGRPNIIKGGQTYVQQEEVQRRSPQEHHPTDQPQGSAAPSDPDGFFHQVDAHPGCRLHGSPVDFPGYHGYPGIFPEGPDHRRWHCHCARHRVVHLRAVRPGVHRQPFRQDREFCERKGEEWT